MNGLQDDEADNVRAEVTGRFSYKNWREHAKCILAHWPAMLLTSAAVFGTVWGLVEASSYLAGKNLQGRLSYLLAVVVAVASAVGRSVFVYIHDCPEGLENESSRARRIAQIQRPKWEYALARQLLRDKLTRLDTELADILSGRVYVPIETRMSLEDYVQWLELRSPNALRMVGVVKQVAITDFAEAVVSREEQAARPAGILNAIDRIRDVYAETVAFERAGRSVDPPPGFETVHALQFGWTEPIRNGIQQLFGFLDHVLHLDPTDKSVVQYTITFDEPANVASFCQELNRLEQEMFGY
jgi:hypothetical protein